MNHLGQAAACLGSRIAGITTVTKAYSAVPRWEASSLAEQRRTAHACIVKLLIRSFFNNHHISFQCAYIATLT
jgi:hypothetical protein